MEIGFTTVTFRDKSIEEIFRIAHENGIAFIEWGGDVHLKYDDTESLEKVKRLSREYNIKACSYGSYYRVGDEDFEKFTSICRLVSSLSMSFIRIWIGSRSSFCTSEKLFNKMVGETKKLCAIAKEYGLIVAGEFHQKTYNDNAKSALKFIDACGVENLKTYWQPLYNYKKDMKNLVELLDKIVVAHLFNWKNFLTRYEFNYNSERWAKFFCLIKTRNILPIMEFVKDDSEGNFVSDVKTIKRMLNGGTND